MKVISPYIFFAKMYFVFIFYLIAAIVKHLLNFWLSLSWEMSISLV